MVPYLLHINIPVSHSRRSCVPLGSLPGLHPDVFVQKPNSLSQELDKHPAHDLSQLKP